MVYGVVIVPTIVSILSAHLCGLVTRSWLQNKLLSYGFGKGSIVDAV
jgi:hypothetical protein